MQRKTDKDIQKEQINEFIKKLSNQYGSLPKYSHLTSTFNNKMYYSGPVVDNNEIVAAIHTLLFGGWISGGGEVAKFEIEYSKKVNNKHTLMVNSGSSADLIMIAGLKKYLNWQDDDEIIISVVGFPTTVSSLTINKLKPIFVDIEMDTLNFDLDLIEEKLKVKDNKIKGIYISPVLANSPDFDRLVQFKNKYNVELILDGCDSLGSKWDGKELNEYCIATSGSLYSAHHISVGQGGTISSNNDDLIRICRSIATWGKKCDCVGKQSLLSNGKCGTRFCNWLPEHPDLILDHRYVFDYEGFNLIPLDLQGSMGIEQLKKLDFIVGNRKKHKDIITNIMLENIKGIHTVNVLEKSDVSWFGTPFICDNTELKYKLVAFLEKNGIQTRNYFAGNILIHPGYKHLDNWEKYPNANEVLKRVFFIGCSPLYTEEVFKYLTEVVKNFTNE